MLSHHPPAQSDLSLASTLVPTSRRASSVTSSRSSRHRHSRNRPGGSSSHLPQDKFPIFSHTGDVEITVKNQNGRKENRYLLHRLILSQCSGFFEAGTRAEWSVDSGDILGAKSGVGLDRISENGSVVAETSSRASSQERRPSFEQTRRKWHYILDWEAAGDDDTPILIKKKPGPPSIFGNDLHSDRPPPVRSRPPPSNERFFKTIANFSSINLSNRQPPDIPVEPGDDLLKDYDNLFRIMYQLPPCLDGVNIAAAYSECKGLLHLADMYDALEIVGSRVDHHLLQFSTRLYKQIAKYPPSYLKLGYLARSRTIFTEALVHVVGQWPQAAPQLRGQLDTTVMELIEDKVDELHELQERVESKLWRINLTTSRGERVTPMNDFLSWLAVSLFRTWLAENTTPPPSGILKSSTSTSQPNHHQRNPSSASSAGGGGGGGNHIASQRIPAPQSPPPAGKIYRLIGSGDTQAYLTHDDLKRALRSPSSQLGFDLYTRDNLKRLERRVDEVKHLAHDAVRPLVRNYLELDLRDFGPAGLGYLTCTRLEGRETPWVE